jgi:hypothetical protein
VLGRERPAVEQVDVGVIAPAQLERVELEPGGQLVEQALEPERALDEAGRAEGGHRARVQLRAVDRRGHVLASVEHLHRPVGSGHPPAPAHGVRELTAERDQRAVGASARAQPLNRRIAVAGCLALFPPRQRAAHGPASAARELGCDPRVVARAVLRPEAAAHELAEDAHAVGRQPELLGQLVADAPDVLRRDVHDERVAFPGADGAVGLHGAVQHRLRHVLGLDDDLRVGHSTREVAAHVRARLVQELAPLDRLVGIEERRALLPLDRDRLHRGASLLDRVGGDRRDGGSGEAGLGIEEVGVLAGESGMDAGHPQCRPDVERAGVGVREGAAQDSGVKHPGQLDVGRVARLAAGALSAVLARRGPADHVERAGGPLLERVLVDDRPDLLVAALDLLLGADQPCHVAIASSMRGYAPQRQRFPAMPWRISSRVGRGFASTSAAAETICPGVQKPHWSASSRTNASTSGCSRRPSIVRTSRAPTVCASVMHESTGTPSSCTVQAPQ